MLVRELKNLLNDSSMQDTNLNIKIVRSGGHRVTLCDVLNAVNALAERVDRLEREVHEGFAAVNARIDNLVSKNHLKE